MKKKTVLLILYYLCSVFSSAQAQTIVDAETLLQKPSAATSRYWGSVEIGFLYGKIENPFNLPPDYKASPSVLLFNGYRAHRMLAIGLTTGFDFYENILITPIGLGIRGTLLSTRVSPFYSLDAGYGSSFLSGKGSGERPEGGWFINPSLGLQVSLDSKTALLFGLGYKQQRVATEVQDWWGGTISQRITYNRLSLRIGFMF